MPVSTDHRQSKRCKHCEEANHGDSVYWNIQLDQDLLNTIISVYPEWFKGLKEGSNNMAQGGGSSAGTSATSVGGSSSQTVLYPRSPPKAEVDESPLQKSMDRNKESLKVKLMLRRPINQLVAQGIMPQLKTSPTIHEQRQKLERAKMGDLLKAKIQQRPDRQELVRQHILEADVGHVDPSLAERQRMLKKCRLVDSLNDQLSHRPGPLELIKKNILHTEEPIERAVKEGHIEFKATSEGQKTKPEHPDHYMTIDDDSQSSDAQSPRDSGSTFNGDMSPPSSHSIHAMVTDGTDLFRHHTGSDMLETAAAQAGIVTVVVAPNASILTTAPSPLSLGSSTSSLSPLSSIASPSSVSCSNGATFACSSPAFTTTARPALPVHQQQPAPGKDKNNRKKSKSKAQQQKTRTIKFHEYKGPPSAQKNSNNSNSSSNSNPNSNAETSYDILLRQQQVILQLQLEWQQKHSQMLVSQQQKSAEQNPSSPSVISLSSPSPSLLSQQMMDQSTSPPPPTPPPPPPLPPPPPPPMPSCNTNVAKPLRNLEDMKVSDLKAELKKRNLRVSGPKPHLIQRLKPYAESTTSNNHSNQTNVSSSNIAIPFNDDSIPDSSVPSPAPQINQPLSISSTEPDPVSKPNSPQMQIIDTSVNKVTSSGENNIIVEQSDEDIIREQQRKIEELQRQLLNSQLLLQQQRQQQQQLQQQARSSQTFQPPQAINAKANLAAFLQQQQLNQQIAQQQQKLQKQIQQQQQQIQQAVLNSNNCSNQLNNKIKTNLGNNNNNLNVVRNINNNIVINNANNTNNITGRERSNTVILGEHPATLVLNHFNIKSADGHHQRTTSLPNFVGTFVQPHLVLSNQGMKQLVFDSDSVIIPEHIKIKNGFINGSVVATANDSTVTSSSPSSNAIEVDVKPDIETLNGTNSQQIVLGNDNYVTLHIGEDEGMTVNEIEGFNQNEEISKIFKQEYNVNESVDDVLDLLMKNGEFDPPESGSTTPAIPTSSADQFVVPTTQPSTVTAPPARIPMETTTSSSTNHTEPGAIYSTSNIDLSLPSQDLSYEQLGIEMETFPMDLREEPHDPPVQSTEFMDVDVDPDWLDRLISSELDHSTPMSSAVNGNYESLLNNNITDPLDFFNIDDNEFKLAAELSWT